MDAMQIGVPILGIVAAAAVTFYAVSFAEIREVNLMTNLIIESNIFTFALFNFYSLCG